MRSLTPVLLTCCTAAAAAAVYPQAEVWWERTRQLQLNNVPVFVSVQAATKGGLVVQYEHIKGFIPVSQLGPVSHCCWVVLGLLGFA
jgi:hypothetical protein